MIKDWIERRIAEFPVCQYSFTDYSAFHFSDKVRYVCSQECEMYGKSWSCPPAVGSVEECKKRCSEYQGAFVFTTIAEVEDMMDLKLMLNTRIEHEKITREIKTIFTEKCSSVLVLSTESCALCETCTYPENSCRFPDQMFPCVESYGILVTELAEKLGISFYYEGNTVTWFSVIFYSE